jgi:hypothetical protein
LAVLAVVGGGAAAAAVAEPLLPLFLFYIYQSALSIFVR